MLQTSFDLAIQHEEADCWYLFSDGMATVRLRAFMFSSWFFVAQAYIHC